MEDSKSFEKKLERDFLSYLNLIKGLFDNVKNENERQLCEVWLTHLVGKNISNLNEKCDRNIFLSRLLIQMQSGSLKGIFLETPPSGSLPCAFTTFSLPSEIEDIKGFEQMGFQVDSSIGRGSGDFFEASRDGRTYLATKTLPQGMMAFLAVTNNDDEEIWMPQSCSPGGFGPEQISPGMEQGKDEFCKKLSQFLGAPISTLRRSPEQRERVVEWMDKIIDDCNKWILGEDPHNMDLEALFEILFDDYKNDPEKAEVLKHPRKVRPVLIRDIRDRISERRAEVLKRELILDQYEAEESPDRKIPCGDLDEVWIQCAQKPMNDVVRTELEMLYPPEVVQRFFELLIQERILIIQQGEKDANKRIAELRRGSLDDIRRELNKLKKVQDDYKEYYSIYVETEKKQSEFEKEVREKCAIKTDKTENIDKVRQEIDREIEQTKRRFDKERRTQNELSEKLDEARENFVKLRQRMKNEACKLECEKNHLRSQKEELETQIEVQKRRRDDLKCKLTAKRNN